jgi:probable rRNA maturation factor
VLAFPLDEPAPRDRDPKTNPDVPLILGDIVVCPEVAAHQAAEHAGTLDDELALLVVHGLLHLLGHDHVDAADRQLMQARERDLLAQFHGPLAGTPWAQSAR